MPTSTRTLPPLLDQMVDQPETVIYDEEARAMSP
jgi:hypothetical protein